MTNDFNDVISSRVRNCFARQELLAVLRRDRCSWPQIYSCRGCANEEKVPQGRANSCIPNAFRVVVVSEARFSF